MTLISIVQCTKYEKPSMIELIVPVVQDMLPSKHEMREWWIANMAKPRVDRSAPIDPTTGEKLFKEIPEDLDRRYDEAVS